VFYFVFRTILSALRGVFSLSDTDNSGYISKKDLGSVLKKIGKAEKDCKMHQVDDIQSEEGDQISFDAFLQVVERENELSCEAPDPKAVALM